MLFLMAPGGVLLGLWLLVAGVNQAKWEAQRRHPMMLKAAN